MEIDLKYKHFKIKIVFQVDDDVGYFDVAVGLVLGAVGHDDVPGVADHDVEGALAIFDGQLELPLDPALARPRGDG